MQLSLSALAAFFAAADANFAVRLAVNDALLYDLAPALGKTFVRFFQGADLTVEPLVELPQLVERQSARRLLDLPETHESPPRSRPLGAGILCNFKRYVKPELDKM